MIIIGIFRFYKRFVSPMFPPCCRFLPTCSVYGMDAVRIHGFFKGLILTAWRILRCNPFGGSGFDPVPPRGKWKNQ